MFGKPDRMNSLASRKQLLIAESELNRVQLMQEWQTLQNEVDTFAKQARSVTSLITVATTLITGFTAGRRKTPEPVAEKRSWWQTLLQGTQVIHSCWNEFRAERNRQNGV